MDAVCRIEVLGPLRAVLTGPDGSDEVVSRFRSRKVALLLSYVALAPGLSVGREVLLEALWPELDERAGRDNLSTTLSALRRQLEPAGVPKGSILSADWSSVSLNPATVTVDAAEFENLTRQAAREKAAPAARAALLGRAVALYRGDPMPGTYDDWAIRAQTAWQERHADALERWAEALAAAGDLEAAAGAASRAVAADPHREECHRLRMNLLARMGRPAAALEAYAALERLLREEMDAPPASETRRLAQRIRENPGSFLAAGKDPGAPGSAEPVAERPPAVPDPPPAPPAASPRLPATFTRFFGREAELAALREMLTEPHGPRLVTLHGPGGSGKTRLAVELARAVAEEFGGRVVFVALADLPSPLLLPSAVVQALGLAPSGAGGEEPLERAVAHLGGSGPSLLILDNLEHLQAERDDATSSKGDRPAGVAPLVRLLLERCAPGLRVLATSRRALNLAGEQVYPVAALPAPAPGVADDPVRLLAAPAAALFVDRARAARPDFSVTAGNAAAVSAVCARLEGMPLAIELAAAWTRVLTPAKMLERLESPLDVLVARGRDLPERHRSLRSAVAWSYDLLEPELRSVFARLSVFRGGWTLEAAQEAVDLPDPMTVLDALARLEEQSLIRAEDDPRTGDTRYRLLEPLREFALERLEESGEAAAATRERHARYFERQVEGRYAELTGGDTRTQILWLESEHDNIRTAIQWGLDHEPAVAQLVAGALMRYWRARGHTSEGRRWCALALAAPGGQAVSRERAIALATHSILSYDQGDLTAALASMEEEVAARRTLHQGEERDHNSLTAAINNLAAVLVDTEELDRADALFEEALALNRAAGNRRAILHNLVNRAGIAEKRGNFAVLLARTEEAVAFLGDEQDPYVQHYIEYLLASHAMHEGDEARAERHHLASLRHASTLGDRATVAEMLLKSARHAWVLGRPERAARVLGAAEALYDALRLPWGSVEAPFLEARDALHAARVTNPPLETAWQEGHTWGEDRAVAYALGEEG